MLLRLIDTYIKTRQDYTLHINRSLITLILPHELRGNSNEVIFVIDVIVYANYAHWIWRLDLDQLLFFNENVLCWM